MPARTLLAYACGAIMVGTGIGLLVQRTAAMSVRVLLVYLVLWLPLLKTPSLFLAPTVEINWNGWGEIAVMVAGAMAPGSSRHGSRIVRPGQRLPARATLRLDWPCSSASPRASRPRSKRP